MRQLIGIISILTLLSCKASSVIEKSKFKTITIKSIGEVETLPDMATFHIDLNCLDKSIQIAKKCLVEKSNELNSTLLSFGISKDDILTTSVSLNKSYVWINNSNVFEGYKSATTVFVTVKNIDKLDEIYTELLGNKNLDLGGLNYSHSRFDSLNNEAYVNALEKAGILTDKLLEKLPETKKEILKISNVEISASLPQPYDLKMEAQSNMADAKNNSVSISKGTVKITATLFVEYLIK